ncbi:MAG TPA: GNAT family N-acetyltransferase [Devosiaceae bacterium]|jgi:GNAT superfamily N-acetyltransferase|nr:GNAT family N-acetyltransferase [Devosiaceae bacterium]
MDIVLKLDPEAGEIEAVRAPLSAHAEQARPGGNYRELGLLLKDPASGDIVGGLTGYALYDWLFVQFLAVPETLRGQNFGSRLMQRAEDWAREQGLAGMWLDTFDFQARPFYEKLGFEVFGTIEDHPVGGRRYFLSKRLTPPAG